jgi:hypothetical protein
MADPMMAATAARTAQGTELGLRIVIGDSPFVVSQHSREIDDTSVHKVHKPHRSNPPDCSSCFYSAALFCDFTITGSRGTAIEYCWLSLGAQQQMLSCHNSNRL